MAMKMHEQQITIQLQIRNSRLYKKSHIALLLIPDEERSVVSMYPSYPHQTQIPINYHGMVQVG
jgi:hypothetical protein